MGNEIQQSVRVLKDQLLRQYDTAFHLYCKNKSKEWFEKSEEIYSDLIRLQTASSIELVVNEIKDKKYF